MTTASLCAGVLNLCFTRGDKVTLALTIKENGAVVSVAGRTFRCQMRADWDGAVVTNFSIDMAQAASGIVTISLPAAGTSSLAGDYVWDFEDVTNGRTLFRGEVKVEKDASRP